MATFVTCLIWAGGYMDVSFIEHAISDCQDTDLQAPEFVSFSSICLIYIRTPSCIRIHIYVCCQTEGQPVPAEVYVYLGQPKQ